MKKTYMQPLMEVEKMELEQMIAESLTIDTGAPSVDPASADSRIYNVLGNFEF